MDENLARYLAYGQSGLEDPWHDTEDWCADDDIKDPTLFEAATAACKRVTLVAKVARSERFQVSHFEV